MSTIFVSAVVRSLLPALLTIVVLAGSAAAGEMTMRKSPFSRKEYEIYEEGRRTGVVRESPFHSGDFEVLDHDGRRENTVRQSSFVPGAYDVLDRDGRRVGTVEADPFTKGRYLLRDRDGRRAGTVRRSPFASEQWEFDPE